MPHLEFKSLRSFMDTYGQELGFSAAQVALRAGHDPAVAARFYTGRVDETDRDLSNAMSDLLHRTESSPPTDRAAKPASRLDGTIAQRRPALRPSRRAEPSE
jgi:hypothetical protein